MAFKYEGRTPSFVEDMHLFAIDVQYGKGSLFNRFARLYARNQPNEHLKQDEEGVVTAVNVPAQAPAGT